ncbi:putative uncharacterized protein [Eggerthella sp. CAG:1427]|nr:putative uncharacterized protein [Eggerthella sp. CAG:1427]
MSNSPILPVPFVSVAVQRHHTAHVVPLPCPQIADRDILVGVVRHHVAVAFHGVVAPVHHIHTLLVGHLERGDVHHVLHLIQEVVALLQQFRIAEGDCREFLRREVVVLQHQLEAVHIDVGDFPDQQDGVPDLDTVFDEIVHVLQSVIVFLALLVNLDGLFEVVDHIRRSRGGLHDVFGGIDNALRQIRGVCHHPLGVCLACQEQAKAA